MAYFSPAVLSSAIALLPAAVRALFAPARGRHSLTAGRRRRSTRVRRYAPLPTPAQALTPAPPHPRPTPRSQPAARPAPRPATHPTTCAALRPTPRPAPTPAMRVAPPRDHIPAEEVALVRGYYRAFEHERDRDRVQAHALRRLDQWTAKPPAGDLLAPVPAPRRPERVVA
ncbi:hypothetical protein [Nocardiopsis aegyptia]|uniref:Uncharacterized protein n=1 Tax=Nocardiopsis aegyptia TaxID=220378 RepID=A0A7Z0JAH9_9ACTN|nr:hypothetical protein [Nocardiopsis aegyptia]NYJ34787.1 hypothetical protein [Nocardiopsis aegyptia]